MFPMALEKAAGGFGVVRQGFVSKAYVFGCELVFCRRRVSADLIRVRRESIAVVMLACMRFQERVVDVALFCCR